MRKYEEYQLKWMIDHGYSILDLIQELETARQDYHPQADLLTMFREWENDTGFGGSIWACEDEWADCEAGLKKPQRISLPIASYESVTGSMQLELTAEENTAPEYGPEIIIGLNDNNGNWLQDLVVVREREFTNRNKKTDNQIEVLIWKDELDENYTSSEKIRMYPIADHEEPTPDAYKAADLKKKYPADWKPINTREVTPETALARSIGEKGKVDMEYMVMLTMLDEEEIAEALEGKIFMLPEPLDENGFGHYVTAGEYLSGNESLIRERLRAAENAAECSDAFDVNVRVLRTLLNEKSYLDETSRKYIQSIGGKIDDQDMIYVPKNAPYVSDSLRKAGKKTIMIPTGKGIVLLLEGKHFNFIEEGKE